MFEINECTNFCIAFDFFFFNIDEEIQLGKKKKTLYEMNSLEIITRQVSGWWFFLIKNVAKTTV